MQPVYHAQTPILFSLPTLPRFLGSKVRNRLFIQRHRGGQATRERHTSTDPSHKYWVQSATIIHQCHPISDDPSLGVGQ